MATACITTFSIMTLSIATQHSNTEHKNAEHNNIEHNNMKHTVFYQVQCALFNMENDAEIFPAHYTWKVAEKGSMMASMINKLAMINSCEIILEK